MIKIIKKHKTVILLMLIFLGGFLLRLYKLGGLPINLHEDEILSGYVGNFILKNGTDIYGNSWPLLYFNKFGDYYIILPFYLSGLGIKLLGASELGVRFFGALLGSLIVIPVFLLSRLTFKNTTVALISAIIIAIMPWHIILSRTTVEGLMGSTIFSFGLVFLLKHRSDGAIRWLVVSSLLFVTSYFFYHPFRIYAPIICLVFVFVNFDKTNIKKSLGAFVMFCLFSLLTIYIASTPWGSGRFNQTSIFSPLSGVSIRTQEAIFNEPSILEARIFNNKILGYSREFLYQYSRYFSPDVLFIRGGNSPRYFVPEQGLLYYGYLPLLLLAIYFLIKKNKVYYDKKNLLMLICLLFISPIPAGLTIIDSPNIHRAIFMTVPLAIFIGYGFWQLMSLGRKERVLSLFLAMFITGELLFFWHQYSVQSDLTTSVSRNDGQRQLVKYLKSIKNDHFKIYVPTEGAMPLYYLFYNNDFDKKYSTLMRSDAHIDKIDNIVFVKKSCTTEIRKFTKIYANTMFIDRNECPRVKDLRLIKKIYGINKLSPYVVYLNNL